MASLYQYEPLSHDDETRLLHLEPGSGDDDIRFTLRPVRLGDKPSYEAISYCWGDARVTREVYCEGKLLVVTNSLYTALKRLRKEDAVRVLWADAVCINQEDIPEKNKQVRLMSRIYAQPSAVLIWLGDDTSGLEGLHECIKGALDVLPPEHFDFEDVYPVASQIFRESARLRRERKPNFLDHDWRPLISVVCRPWFGRRWVIQEVTLADDSVPRLAICGEVEFSWSDLASVAYRMACYGITPLLAGMSSSKPHRTQAKTTGDADPGGLVNSNAPYMLSFFVDGCKPLYMLTAVYMTYLVKTYREPTLVDCVTATSVFQCTDSKDHLYSLLSLARDIGGVEADYSLSIEEVCTRFAITTLVSRQDLKLLSLAPHTFIHPDAQELKRLALPSWVPDLTCQGVLTPLVSYSIRPQLFRAGGSEMSEVRISSDSRVLHVRGRIVDKVAKMTKPLIGAPYPTEEDIAPKTGFHALRKMFLRNWFQDCYEVAGEKYPRKKKTEAATEQTAIPEERREDAELRRGFLETLLCGMTMMRDPVPEEVLGATQVYVEYLFDYFTDGFELSEEVREIMLTHGAVVENSLFNVTECRRFCRTEQGRLGQVRNEAREGDLFVCIVGAEVPFLLRPSEEKEGVYTLVGDVFLLGVMQGEAFSDLRYETVHIAIE